MSRNFKLISIFILSLAYTTSVSCMDTKSIEDMLIAAATAPVPNINQAKRALDQGANPNDILIGYVHPHAIRDNTVHGKPLLHMALHSAPLTRFKEAFSIAQAFLKRDSLSEEQRENYKLITEKLAMILQALSS